MRFNADVIVPHSRWAESKVLYLSSMFRTLQGEGPQAGLPAVFVRFAGCNFGNKEFACRFCDTNFQVASATAYEAPELVLKTRGMAERGDLIIITGGEPTVQSPSALAYFVDNLSFNHHVQFETNGTNIRVFEALAEKGAPFSIVCSPKAINGTYTRPALLKFCPNYKVPVSYKFVVSADPSDPHHTIPDWAHSQESVYVSPMTVYKQAPQGEVTSIWDADLVDQEATARNYHYAAEYVLKHPGLRLSLQTHLFTAIA